MPHPIEQAADTLIAALRRHDGSAVLAADGEVLLAGLWSSHDAEQGRLTGRYVTGAGALLRLELEVTQPGRWCTLSFALGDAALAEDAVIGVVADLRASAPCEIGLGLRSVTAGGARDTGFAERFAAGPESRAQAALLTVAAASPLTDPARRRLLQLQMPQQSGWVEIRDLRLFVQPATGMAESIAVSPPEAAVPPEASAG